MPVPRLHRLPRQMTEHQCADIAYWWLEPLVEGGKKPLSQAELARKFATEHKRSIDQKTVITAVRYAFHKKLLVVNRDESIDPCSRDEALEHALKKRWGIRSAVVVASDELYSKVKADDFAGVAKKSDIIHRQLGLKLAELIEQTPGGFFRERDIVGIGSGRAIYNLVTSLNRQPTRFNIPNVTLMSLTGTVYPEASIDDSGKLLDADLNTVYFANCFSGPTPVRTISFPIAHDHVSIARRNTWLHNPNHPDDELTDAPSLSEHERKVFETNEYTTHIPTHAFVGVGVLSEKTHRLYREVQDAHSSDQRKKGGGQDENNRQTSTMLRPIRDKLRDLIQLAEKVSKESSQEYFPVADICHRLFFVDPPSKAKIATDDQQKILKYISDINCHTLTVTKTQLNEINNVVLIAGGEQKSLVIRRRLELRFPRFSVLCTDAKTAEQLLQ